MSRGEQVTGRVAVIDGLRGLASLGVAWYHLAYADGAFAGGGLVAGVIRDSARNAWTGVEVFFVISGFVIPLALFRAGYHLRAYPSFLLKRIVRLDPPYLVSAALCLLLWYLWAVVPHLNGPAFNPSPAALLLHLGYLNAFFHQGWLNPVYWTLAIEFQYYLGMGLLFVLLADRRWGVRAGTMGLLSLAAFLLPSPALVFHYLFAFLLGLATFQRFVGLLSGRAYIVYLVLLTAGCERTLGPMVAGICLAVALVISLVHRPVPVLTFFGTISYSLYLIHVPVGGRILGLGLSHVHGGPARVLVLAVTMALTVGAATLFYRYVERPAQRWSSALRYGSRGADRGRAVGRAVVTGIAEP